jgi:meso-butanediol dehydrogenase/(S,S)-butanediol dehydrogenase/diacetyl reductase
MECRTLNNRARFESQVALITGGASGIGYSVARAFCEEGGRVMLVGRRGDALERAIGGLPRGTAMATVGDHADESVAARAIDTTIATHGRLDFLFNNAGSYEPVRVADCDLDGWERALRSNLRGPFLFTRAAIRHLRATRGAIVNNSSGLGQSVARGVAPYSVAKAALEMLTRVTALEESEYGVRVNAVAPGVVDTPIHASGTAANFAGIHPLGRIGSPADVTSIVLFLASAEASWITGTVIPVDGGLHLGN